MKRFSEINNTISTWNGSFEKLVKQFNNEDYSIILQEQNFIYIDLECIYDALESGNWYDFLKLYIEEILHQLINDGGTYSTGNLFRLWYETV